MDRQTNKQQINDKKKEKKKKKKNDNDNINKKCL